MVRVVVMMVMSEVEERERTGALAPKADMAVREVVRGGGRGRI